MINNKIVDHSIKIEDLYAGNKDAEDEILYIKYSNVDSF